MCLVIIEANNNLKICYPFSLCHVFLSLLLGLAVTIITTKRPSGFRTLVSYKHVTAKIANRPSYHYKCINSPLSFRPLLLTDVPFFRFWLLQLDVRDIRLWRTTFIAFRLANRRAYLVACLKNVSE